MNGTIEKITATQSKVARYFLSIPEHRLRYLLSCAPAIAQSGAEACGPLRGQGQYGPYDYHTHKDKLQVVERYHFTAVVEALTRGSQNTLAGGDIDYTLRAFPNRHRALLAMVPALLKQIEIYFSIVQRKVLSRGIASLNSPTSFVTLIRTLTTRRCSVLNEIKMSPLSMHRKA